jgi:3-ketosteroid 9alpha-monooxygenase subunit B
MALSPAVAAGERRDHAFHPLRVTRVLPETADACSIALEIPDEAGPAFAYQAGQFVTLRVCIDGETHLRSYSMSSAPGIDDFAVTVKRVPGGVVSNWINDHLRPGDVIESTCPAGVFCLQPVERDIVAFAAGSGITPVFSLLKIALATTGRRVRLLYANRDPSSVIFAAPLSALTSEHRDRLSITHHFDVESGFVDAASVGDFVDDADYYVCGPGPFMDVVETTLLERGVDSHAIRIERFTPVETKPAPASAAAGQVTVELDGRVASAAHHPGTTILQMARQMGLAPPYSCESGSCATCMARLVEGEVTMHVNNALTDDEVKDGWVLTCQSVPMTPSVRVVYEEA